VNKNITKAARETGWWLTIPVGAVPVTGAARTRFANWISGLTGIYHRPPRRTPDV